MLKCKQKVGGTEMTREELLEKLKLRFHVFQGI